ncbi:MAG: hypothetical protein H6702_10980 [Myxococcales bacterium]|nr:hypothetical protein [Myxococcales bacterium]
MRRIIALLALWMVAASCAGGDLSLGLSGCDGGPVAFERTPTNTVPGAGHATLTAAGVDVLIQQREALAGLLLDVDADGWVRLALPPLDFGTRGGRLGVGVRDVAVGFDLRAAQIDLQVLPEPTRLRLTVGDARVRLDDGVVWVTVGGDAACRLGNGLNAGAPDAALVVVDLSVDLILAVDGEGRLQVEVEVRPFTVRALDFELVYDPALPECADGSGPAECRLACGAGDLAIELGEALRDALDSELDRLFQPVVQLLVDAVTDVIGQQPLGVAGELHPRILAELLPTAADALPLQFEGRPSPAGITLRSAGDDGDGLGLTFDVGLDTPADHPCVPQVGEPPPLRPGPAPVLSGYDHTGAPYAVGLALSDAAVNRAVWAAYRAGALCAALDTDQVQALSGQRVDTGTLALVLPGLAELTLGPRPVRIGLDPRFKPQDLPLATFFPVADDGGIPQAGIRLVLPDVGLSFYGLVEERWSRLFAADATLRLDVVVQAAPDDRLVITVARPEIVDLRQTYNELLSGADLPALLELVGDLTTSVLLRDGLSLDFGLRGLVPQLTGLPLELGIAALRVEGDADDFLSVLMRLEAGAPSGLAPQADTFARLVAARPGQVTLAVEAAGAPAARYQWRVDGLAWRPLTTAPEGRLVIADGRLHALGPHRVEVRAVAEGDPDSLDPTPAVVTFDIQAAEPAPTAPTPAAPAEAQGCQQAPGGAGLAGLSLLLLLGTRRRRFSLLALLLLGGCGDDPPTADALACAQTADCPGGLYCLDGLCARPDPCATSADCCPGAECRGGACLPPTQTCAEDGDCAVGAACEGGRCVRVTCEGGCPAGTTCVADRCHRGPPCRAACAADEACYPDLDVCRQAPPGCGPCPQGQVRVVQAPERYRGALCDVSDAACACAVAPALVPADYGRHASMALVDGAPVFAAWDADYGDLVWVTGVEAGVPQVTYLDGVPEAPAAADPAGPRGGVVEPGPDRGRYASLAVDGKGRAHIAYYDSDAGHLRYLRQTDDRAGWLPPVVVDDDGDVGRYPVIAVDSRHRPHVLYHVVRSRGGRAGARLAFTEREAFEDGAWTTLDLVSRAAEGPAVPPGVTPAEPGVMPCMRLGLDGRVHAAFYDGARGWPVLVRGRPGEAFAVAEARGSLVAEGGADPDPLGRYARLDEHDLGRFCDVVYDPQADEAVAVFLDATTDALLLYRGPVDGFGAFEIVDPGGGGQRRLVGADPALALAPDGRPVVVYQDATANDLLLAARGPSGWTAAPVRIAGREGAVGFHNSLILVGDRAVVGTLELRTLPDGRGDHRLRVVRTALP